MRKDGFIVHGLINFCLIAILGVIFIACGLSFGENVITASKSYNGVIYAGNETSNKVSLMINVYWGTEYLSDMLDSLKKHNAKATFFVGGTWVQENPELLSRIYKEGHEIGNHGTNHKEHARLSYEQNKIEIQNCHTAVQRVLGIDMDLFMPPGGSYGSKTVESASELGYKTILWTRDTIDWKDQREDIIFSRATNKVQSGDLILMHPTNATRNVLDEIIESIKNQGFELTTVSETLKD